MVQTKTGTFRLGVDDQRLAEQGTQASQQGQSWRISKAHRSALADFVKNVKSRT